MSGQLQEMEIRDLSCDVFQVFQHATPLLSAGSAEKFNTMVIGWGGLGTLWGKADVYKRQCRCCCICLRWSARGWRLWAEAK